MRNRLYCFLLLAFCGLTSLGADEIHIAVASHFNRPMQALAADFEARSPHRLRLSFGASGKFYTQIMHGAPFHLFLSADEETPLRLVAAGKGEAKALFIYAQGQLVLWSPRFLDIAKPEAATQLLREAPFKHLAIANPKTAPYGAAADKVLSALGLKTALSSRLVQGENIAQTWQFVASGHAELGFVALSQVIDTDPTKRGAAWIIPQSLYPPLKHAAIILPLGHGHPATQTFVEYLKSERAQTLLKGFGYLF